MTRTVRAFLPVPGDATALRRAFVGDPGRWLPEARHTGPDRWAMTVRAGQLARTVEARVGEPWRAGGTQWRSLGWEPAADDGTDRLLPSLDGELGLHVLEGVATAVLDARYHPPGGPVGAALDGVALHRVARSTAQRLLADVAAGLTAESLLALEPVVADEDPGTGPDDPARATTR